MIVYYSMPLRFLPAFITNSKNTCIGYGCFFRHVRLSFCYRAFWKKAVNATLSMFLLYHIFAHLKIDFRAPGVFPLVRHIPIYQAKLDFFSFPYYTFIVFESCFLPPAKATEPGPAGFRLRVVWETKWPSALKRGRDTWEPVSVSLSVGVPSFPMWKVGQFCFPITEPLTATRRECIHAFRMTHLVSRNGSIRSLRPLSVHWRKRICTK